MLDQPEKTRDLLAILQAAAPFDVQLSSLILDQLRAQRAGREVKSRQTVSKISYAGDEGGILCHLEPDHDQEVLIVSLTHLHIPRTLPFSAAVLAYQKHRTKKLKKLHGA